MIFKKRKEAKELSGKEIKEVNRIAGHALEELEFADAIKKADQIADPAEKILALRQIKNEITDQIWRENRVIAKKANSKGMKAGLAGGGASIAAGVAVAALAGPVGWIGVPVMYAGVFGATALTGMRAKSAQKKLQKEASAHLQRMEGQKTVISEMTNAVVENNVKAISQSPLYGEVVASPGIAQKFADAAAKHIATAGVPPVEAAPVEVQKPAPRKKQKQNFDKIIKAVKPPRNP